MAHANCPTCNCQGVNCQSCCINLCFELPESCNYVCKVCGVFTYLPNLAIDALTPIAQTDDGAIGAFTPNATNGLQKALGLSAQTIRTDENGHLLRPNQLTNFPIGANCSSEEICFLIHGSDIPTCLMHGFFYEFIKQRGGQIIKTANGRTVAYF